MRNAEKVRLIHRSMKIHTGTTQAPNGLTPMKAPIWNPRGSNNKIPRRARMSIR